MPVPATRYHAVNDRPLNADGRHVLYWMTAHRRLHSNFALERAVDLAVELRRPLVVFEPLRVDYQWASDRLHRFVIDGMADHARTLATTPVQYLPHVERQRGDGWTLLDALARDAVSVVTDDYPAFFLPGAVARAGARLPARLEAVDSNGLLPIRSGAKRFTSALSFRAFMQQSLRAALADWPANIGWTALPSGTAWVPPSGRPAPTPTAELNDPTALIQSLPIDHTIGPVLVRGGSRAAQATLARFITSRLARYADDRNHPDLDGASGLSPYLHFGHLSSHEVFHAVMTAEQWTSRQLAPKGGGRREGWWGISASAEAFLDQLITWRELGLQTCAVDPAGYDQYTSLPDWARRTLADHAADVRPVVYTRDQFESAATHDQVWNAAARQLTQEGWMHNYLRMLWGKKILEWSPSPDEALDHMIQIMNRHALDGRDPNSYTGYLWTLGKFDRPWGPARPVFGTVRYMSSLNTTRKLKMRQFLARYGADNPALVPRT